MKVEIFASNCQINNSILHLGYLELVMASGKIPDMFEARNMAKLENAVSAKFREKLKHTDVYSVFSVKKSFLLGAEITLQKNVLVKKEDKILLENFVKFGGTADPSQYMEISKIVNL